MPSEHQWRAAKARQKMYAALRSFFVQENFLEVETPCLVPVPGLDLHIEPFIVPFRGVDARHSLYLHTSPEYAMKRLLSDDCPAIFQFCKAFRNGETSQLHNPEFTMLEFYRTHVDYHAIMQDLERALANVEAHVSPDNALLRKTPYERLTVQDAFMRHLGINLSDGADLKQIAQAQGVHTGTSIAFEDVFFHLFLEKIEPHLGRERPTFLIEYPASMASLARLKPSDNAVAERFELYANGVELANGFTELDDPIEHRARLVAEQGQRLATRRQVFPLDEALLEAIGRMPESAGIAVGLDRVLMLLLQAQDIADVLLFPAKEFFNERKSGRQ